MKTLRLLLVLALLPVSGCIIAIGNRVPANSLNNSQPSDFAINVSCTETDLPFTGTVTTDGTKRDISGAGNGSFHFNAHQLECSIKKAGTNGTLSVTIIPPGEKEATVIAPPGLTGVRLEFTRSGSTKSSLLTAF